MIIPPKLSDTLLQAIGQCHTSIPIEKRLEEHGGWILNKGDEFKFFFLRNDNTGTPRANVLFTANREDVGRGPLKYLVKDGWKNYGTFHTHPQFPVSPSDTDWNFLFQNSPYNFIYSPVTLQLGVSHFIEKTENGQKWQQNVFDVVDGVFTPAKRIRRPNE